MDGSKTAPRHRSLIWEAALGRYNARNGNGTTSLATSEAFAKAGELEDLLGEVERLAPPPVAGIWTKTAHQIHSLLLGVVDFIAILTWTLFVNGRVAATVPGLIWLALTLSQPVLPEAFCLVGDLRRDLDDLRGYETNLRMTPSLERALSLFYSEAICFCAHSVTFSLLNSASSRDWKTWCWARYHVYCAIRKVRDAVREVDDVADAIPPLDPPGIGFPGHLQRKVPFSDR